MAGYSLGHDPDSDFSQREDLRSGLVFGACVALSLVLVVAAARV